MIPEKYLKSHTRQEIIDALQNGERVYGIDSGNDGDDDMIICSDLDEVRKTIAEWREGEVPEYYQYCEIGLAEDGDLYEKTLFYSL